MKKIILPFIAGCLSLLSSAKSMNAQDVKKQFTLADLNSIYAQTSVGIKPRVGYGGATPVNTINSRALKDFKKTFTDIRNASWYNLSDGYLARFVAGDVDSRVYYNKKGKWNCTIRYYNERKMPRSLRSDINIAYCDYKITGVEQLDVPGTILYIVHLENADSMKILYVHDGEISVNEELTLNK